MFLLDTVVASEVRKPSRHGGVMAWIGSTPAEHQYLSAVSFWEFARGIAATRRQDPVKAGELQLWMNSLLATSQILPATAPVFLVFHDMRARTGRSSIEDLLIAATAQVPALTMVTRNTKHFVGLGVPVFDPWTGTIYP